jgi:hypothetical protein
MAQEGSIYGLIKKIKSKLHFYNLVITWYLNKRSQELKVESDVKEINDETYLRNQGFVNDVKHYSNGFVRIEIIAGLYFISHTVSSKITFMGDTRNDWDAFIKYFKTI